MRFQIEVSSREVVQTSRQALAYVEPRIGPPFMFKDQTWEYFDDDDTRLGYVEVCQVVDRDVMLFKGDMDAEYVGLVAALAQGELERYLDISEPGWRE